MAIGNGMGGSDVVIDAFYESAYERNGCFYDSCGAPLFFARMLPIGV